ncbi:phage/plasmid primase, P4 family [Desulfobaculum senezii]
MTDLAAMREKVAARRAEELGSDPDEDDPQHGGGGGGSNNVDSAFVLACCEQEDLGLGRLYAAMHKGHFLYVGQGREWLRFNGHHWDMDPHPERARAEVEAVSERLLDEHSKLGTAATEAEQAGDKDLAKFHRAKQKLIMKRVSRMRRQNGPGVVLEFAAGGRNGLSIFGDELDNAEWLLGCANGVVDLRTGLLRGGRPEDYILKASPTEFVYNAPAPRWEQFLREILSDDQDMVDYTRRLFGSCLRCGNKEHVLPVLHGKGRNGKSLLVEMVQHVLGPLGGPIPAEMLLDQNAARNADAPSPSIMGLRGMRAVFASETDEGRRFSASRCKWLSGGDTLTGRWPNDKRSVTFAPTHTLFLLTNHKPHAPADDFAFWERLHLIPFERSFVDREPKDETEMRRDDGLKAALLKEAPGILSWLVQGCLEWQRDGLNPPAKVRAATEDYRRDEDLLALFIDDCCELVPADENDTRTRTNATELYDAFVRWFAVNISRKKQFPQRKFGALAQQKFAKRKVGGKNWYYGVLLTTEARESMQGSL